MGAGMGRTSQLFRDYGLAIGLVVASTLLYFKTLVPQIEENRALEQTFLRQRQEIQKTQREVERLRVLEHAGEDPLVIERLSRQLYGDLGFPSYEVLVGPLRESGAP